MYLKKPNIQEFIKEQTERADHILPDTLKWLLCWVFMSQWGKLVDCVLTQLSS